MVSAHSYRKIRKQSEQYARCSAGKETKAPQRSGNTTGNGFLRHRFLPVRENKYPVLRQQRKTEREFFASLSHLANLYGFHLPQVAQHPFPFNITAAYNQAKERLKQLAPNLQLIIIQNETHTACLATVSVYNTGTTLYYVPVRPLIDLLKVKERRPAAQLILSIFSYLYHIVKLPYHRDESSYLSYCYEAMTEWYLDSGEWEKEDYKHNLQQLKTMRKGGDTIRKKISPLTHLNQFENRLKKFTPADNCETELLQLATEAFSLWQSNTQRSIFDSIPEQLLDPETDERITADRYLSFFWDSEDNIYESLMEYINSDLQEYGVIDEPVSIQFFDTPQHEPSHDLSFEINLFKLIDDLCTILNKLV